MYKVILILYKFFLKYEGGSIWPPPPTRKTTLKKPSLIRVKRKIRITGEGADAATKQADERDRGITFKNCTLFINCKN